MSLLPLLVISLTSLCHYAKPNIFNITWNQNLGVKQCQMKCLERRGCNDVDYSLASLSCTLRFNLSQLRHLQNHLSCLRHYCTECMVLTRFKQKYVLVIFNVRQDGLTGPLAQLTSASPNTETLLTFKSIGKGCKQTGKNGNSFESTGIDCKMRSVQTLKSDKAYKFVFQIAQTGGVRSGRVYFKIRNHDEIISFNFFNQPSRGYFYSDGKGLVYLHTLSPPIMEVVMMDRVIYMKCLESSVSLGPVQLWEGAYDFVVKISMEKNSNMMILITNNR